MMEPTDENDGEIKRKQSSRVLMVGEEKLGRNKKSKKVNNRKKKEKMKAEENHGVATDPSHS